MALIRTLADMRCIIRHKQVVNWLIDDVARTQDALALEMLHAFTKRIMPRDSKEMPADVFECNLQQVKPVRLIATGAAKAARDSDKEKESKNRSALDEQTTHGRTRAESTPRYPPDC